MSGGVPECMACGACCFSTLPEYVRVFGSDWDRMGDEARALTQFIGNRCYMDLSSIVTLGNLRDGLRYCVRRMRETKTL